MRPGRHNFALAALLALGATTSALGHDAPTQAELDAIAAQPGTQIETTGKGEGKTIRIVRNQVTTILKQSSDGEWSETSVDNSGRGAVLCAWMIYVDLRALIDLCQLNDQQALRTDLDSSIDRIRDFVVANSLFPTTKEQISERAARQLEILRTEEEKLSPATRLRQCEAGDFSKMLNTIGAQSHADRTKSVDELLSVPRPPALEPCL
ncbi:MAG TPA: hypothetical protein VL899_02355 [Alphaproteobacteria bacterium]|nr:hypothetical protein [Alphaproteobacteria bacterium]